MMQTVLFKDLGAYRSYKEIWDLQESLLQENVRRKQRVDSCQLSDGDEQGKEGVVSCELLVVNELRELSPDSFGLSEVGEQKSGTEHIIKKAQLTTDNSQSTTNNAQLSTHNPNLSSSSINHLLFVEHKPVYTLGKSGDICHVLIDEREREEKGIEFFKINRGGDITFHGPGQLVGYPILDLDNFKTDLGWYLRNLEEVIIVTMAQYGLKGDRSKGETGVWIDPGIKGKERKICAMGIRCSRWITMHGFAFNVNTDLEYFNYIIPCGIKNKQVTSLQTELGYEIPMAEVKQKVRENFGKVFGAEMVEVVSCDL